MQEIILNTSINAPIELVFDLSRSINLHETITSGTNEKAIAGKTSGLLELNETVTWKAKHLGITQKLTVRMSEFKRPYYFTDVMEKGAFKSMVHKHSFKNDNEGTIMTDHFRYSSPLGVLGKMADMIFLKNYMTNFLKNKNTELKKVAESDKWKFFLNEAYY